VEFSFSVWHWRRHWPLRQAAAPEEGAGVEAVREPAAAVREPAAAVLAEAVLAEVLEEAAEQFIA